MEPANMPEDRYQYHGGDTPDSVQFPQPDARFPARKIFEEFLGPPRPTDRVSGRGQEGIERPAEQRIVDVLLRNDDFGYGTKRDRVSELFKEYVAKGPEAVKQIVDKVNAELQKRGSQLKLDGSHSVQTRHETFQPDAGNLAVYLHPIHYKITEQVGSFNLKNRHGELEDSISVVGSSLKEEVDTDPRLIPRFPREPRGPSDPDPRLPIPRFPREPREPVDPDPRFIPKFPREPRGPFDPWLPIPRFLREPREPQEPQRIDPDAVNRLFQLPGLEIK